MEMIRGQRAAGVNPSKVTIARGDAQNATCWDITQNPVIRILAQNIAQELQQLIHTQRHDVCALPFELLCIVHEREEPFCLKASPATEGVTCECVAEI